MNQERFKYYITFIINGSYFFLNQNSIVISVLSFSNIHKLGW